MKEIKLPLHNNDYPSMQRIATYEIRVEDGFEAYTNNNDYPSMQRIATIFRNCIKQVKCE